jgi:hypothetical protein
VFNDLGFIRSNTNGGDVDIVRARVLAKIDVQPQRRVRRSRHGFDKMLIDNCRPISFAFDFHRAIALLGRPVDIDPPTVAFGRRKAPSNYGGDGSSEAQLFDQFGGMPVEASVWRSEQTP